MSQLQNQMKTKEIAWRFNEKTQQHYGIMDTCLLTSHRKQPKSTTTTMTHPTDLAPHRRISDTQTPGQTAGLTPTAPALQWLAWPPSSLKACGLEHHPQYTTPIRYFITAFGPSRQEEATKYPLRMTNFVINQ